MMRMFVVKMVQYIIEVLAKITRRDSSRFIEKFLESYGEALQNKSEALKSLSEVLSRRNVAIQMRLRQLQANQQKFSSINDRWEKMISEKTPPWLHVQLSEYQIPGMISEEEKKYYTYLGQFYTGEGEVVEIGPWLGCSTLHIVNGLRQNPHFHNRKLYVYDDFIWRSSWMEKFYSEQECPQDHEDFKPLFDKFTLPLKDFVVAKRARLSTGELEEDFGNIINPYDKYPDIPHLQWNQGAVEMCFVDVGRTIDVNEAWWRTFHQYFIASKTLIIIQDWQTHKEVPVQWYNQMKMFTDGKHESLELIHELLDGGTATFLFKG